MYFNGFLYLFTGPAILTAAKTKIIFILRNSNLHGDLYNGFLLYGLPFMKRIPMFIMLPKCLNGSVARNAFAMVRKFRSGYEFSCLKGIESEFEGSQPD